MDEFYDESYYEIPDYKGISFGEGTGTPFKTDRSLILGTIYEDLIRGRKVSKFNGFRENLCRKAIEEKRVSFAGTTLDPLYGDAIERTDIIYTPLYSIFKGVYVKGLTEDNGYRLVAFTSIPSITIPRNDETLHIVANGLYLVNAHKMNPTPDGYFDLIEVIYKFLIRRIEEEAVEGGLSAEIEFRVSGNDRRVMDILQEVGYELSNGVIGEDYIPFKKFISREEKLNEGDTSRK